LDKNNECLENKIGGLEKLLEEFEEIKVNYSAPINPSLNNNY